MTVRVVSCVIQSSLPFNDTHWAVLLLSVCGFEIVPIFSNLSIKKEICPVSRYFPNYSSNTHTHAHTHTHRDYTHYNINLNSSI